MKSLKQYFFIGLLCYNSLQIYPKDWSESLTHVCAYSNESVVKFREKMLQKGEDILFPGFLFDWPIDLCEFWISSLFGYRNNPSGKKMHNGVDMAAVKGTLVKAAADGVVVEAKDGLSGYGNMVDIEHKNKFITRYAHLDKIAVKERQKVKKGDVIGFVGATGNVRGILDPSHLHFEILKDNKRIDPLLYLYLSEIGFNKR